jgi:hypothetical protein
LVFLYYIINIYINNIIVILLLKKNSECFQNQITQRKLNTLSDCSGISGSPYCSCKKPGSWCKTDGKCHGLLEYGKEIDCHDPLNCIKLLSIKPYFRQCYLCFEDSRFIYIGDMYNYETGLILSGDSTHKTSFCINSPNETIKSGDKITFTETIPTYPTNKYLHYNKGYDIIFDNTATIFVIKNINGNIGDCITPTTKFNLYMIEEDGITESILGYREIDNTGAIKNIRPITSKKVLPAEFFQDIILTLVF